MHRGYVGKHALFSSFFFLIETLHMNLIRCILSNTGNSFQATTWRGVNFNNFQRKLYFYALKSKRRGQLKVLNLAGSQQKTL